MNEKAIENLTDTEKKCKEIFALVQFSFPNITEKDITRIIKIAYLDGILKGIEIMGVLRK